MRRIILSLLCLSLAPLLSFPASAEGVTNVIIYGKRTPGGTARTTILSSDRASSCGFMTGNIAYESRQGYLTSMGYEPDEHDPYAVYIYSPNGDASREIRTAPFDSIFIVGPGSASGTPSAPFMSSGGMPFCRNSDRALAAGRAYIQRRDTTLRQALEAYDQGDYASAIPLLEKAWRKIGYGEAALMLGHMYVLGLGTDVNVPQGIDWLKKAAHMPYETLRFSPLAPERSTPKIDASLTLASLYMTGYGVPKDNQKALDWYQKAANTGHLPSLNLLGTLFLNGQAGLKDSQKAFKYYKKAAENGYAPAQYNLARLYAHGEGTETDPKLAASWDYHSARAGYAPALYQMAIRYDHGEDGLAHDPQKALVYYKEAALKGQPDAINALATSFYAGEDVTKDTAIARQWFEQAALRGQTDAMFNLGVMLTNGEGGDADQGLAYVWFSLAQSGGHENAARALSRIEGKMSPQDRQKARQILSPAI